MGTTVIQDKGTQGEDKDLQQEDKDTQQEDNDPIKDILNLDLLEHPTPEILRTGIRVVLTLDGFSLQTEPMCENKMHGLLLPIVLYGLESDLVLSYRRTSLETREGTQQVGSGRRTEPWLKSRAPGPPGPLLAQGSSRMIIFNPSNDSWSRELRRNLTNFRRMLNLDLNPNTIYDLTGVSTLGIWFSLTMP